MLIQSNSSVTNRTMSEPISFGLTPLQTGEEEMCMAELGPAEWLIIVLYGMVILMDITGNGIVCYLIFTERQLRTVTNFFLANLAVADIAKACTGIPFSLMVNLIYRYWPFAAALCPFVAYIEIVVVFASAFTLVAMSVDRYIAILHPLRPKLTRRGVFLSIIVVWLLAFAMPIPTAFTAGLQPQNLTNSSDVQPCYNTKELCYEKWPTEYQKSVYSLIIMTLQYGIPLVVLAFTYTRIAIIIWVQRTPGEAWRERDERLASSKRKMVKMMIVVVLLYALCWLPLHTLQVYSDLDPSIYDSQYSHLLWNFITWLALAHACCNPIIYFGMNKKFKYGFLRMFVCCGKAGVPSRESTLNTQQYTMNTFHHRNSATWPRQYSALSRKSPNNSPKEKRKEPENM